MYQLEFDPAVLRFREQPKTYELTLSDRKATYTPDLEVIRMDGIVIEEVKPLQHLLKYKARFEAMRDIAASEGKRFEVVTEEQIRRQPYLANIKLLLSFRHYEMPTDTAYAIREILQAEPEITLGRLANRLSSDGRERWAPWAMLANHMLLADLEQPLGPETFITLNIEDIPCLPSC